MGAIFGALRLGDAPLEGVDLESMGAALRGWARGGVHLWQGRSVALGRAFRPNTPEALTEEPIAQDPGRGVTLVATGRLDNRDDLLRGLDVAPPRWSSTPDTELLKRGYAAWGESLPRRLEGDFAFALWDEPRRKLLLVRDQLGVKPLYLAEGHRTLIFASSIPAVLAAGVVNDDLDEAVVVAWLHRSPIERARTFFRGVRRSSAGSMLVVDGASVRETRYWTAAPAALGRRPSLEVVAEALRAAVITGVESRLRSSTPVGVLLSGGLDSSAVACIAARKLRAQGRTLHAVSSVLPIGHSGPEQDERSFVEDISQQEANLLVHWVTPGSSGILDGLEDRFAEIGEPVDPFHDVSTALTTTLADAGVGTALAGTEGDLCASHDGRFALADLLGERRWWEALEVARRLRAARGLSWSTLVARDFLPGLLPAARRVLGWLGSLRSTDCRGDSPVSRQSWDQYGEILSRQQRELAQDGHRGLIAWRTGHGSAIIEGQERYCSPSSIEVSFPLWTPRIVETILAAPPSLFFGGGRNRHLFRVAMRGVVPERIRLRPDKQPFVPNFHQRLQRDAGKITGLLDALDLDAGRGGAVARFVDSGTIRRQLPRIRRPEGWHDWDQASAHAVGFGVILTAYVLWYHEHR